MAEHEAKYPDDHEEEPEKWEQVVNRRVRLMPGKDEDGDDAFVIAEDWKSDWQVEQERRRDEHRKRERERRDKWLAEDAFYQHLIETAGRNAFRLSYSHQSMMSRWKGDTNEVYLRATVRDESDGLTDRTSTLFWGHNEGPIKTELWVRGKGNIKSPEFERSIEGLQAAWKLAQEHCARKEVT